MSLRAPFLSAVFAAGLATVLALAGCANQASSSLNYGMGDRVTVGPLTYNVVEAAWRSQLGEAFKLRIPEQRFLLVTISVTNGGGKELSVPLLNLEDQKGQSFQELSDGEGVNQWFGLLRNLKPAQTEQGQLVFDVPLTSYRLRLTDAADAGAEKVAWVDIPLRMDTDSSIISPLPGKAGK